MLQCCWRIQARFRVVGKYARNRYFASPSIAFEQNRPSISDHQVWSRFSSTAYPRFKMAEATMTPVDQTLPGGGEASSTQIVPIAPSKLGEFLDGANWPSQLPLDDWSLELYDTADARHLVEAAQLLRNSTIPVAFPTETVYGLGADATRSEAVKGIYKAKQRPSDNPLIVHIASLQQLRCLLLGSRSATNPSVYEPCTDPIPDIYKPLIEKFWPGPLTILLPVPENSPLAPETTAGLATFGARMPRNLLALALIKLADRPIAAPSANASTKPSPTAAEHVYHDLAGRIEMIVDGGPCQVGVESTVADGLVSPPVILRPGGVSIGQIREVKGWEKTTIAYEDKALMEGKKEGPRAPGMKYRHYSPKAKVMLFESGRDCGIDDLAGAAGSKRRVGVVRTKRWKQIGVEEKTITNGRVEAEDGTTHLESVGKHVREHKAGLPTDSPLVQMLAEQSQYQARQIHEVELATDDGAIMVLDISIGPDTIDIARGLFSALRDLDKKDLDAIIVEGIEDGSGDDVSAAVMNRLRKAAEVNVL
ncbi:DHBP synthase RibB-like alpha/beta domain-containing protein [Elsinoe ampelina]|uniref:Threonylcarbamoyl-AMP synthase n=1 Tax=Elsinoe ampelina TaxID=302913 RepID=A0A6A6FYU0_9PEZI|nr:DHBP synthase RibB-like alpha/beta domain-containing protein [Elsinoe ampelina]